MSDLKNNVSGSAKAARTRASKRRSSLEAPSNWRTSSRRKHFWLQQKRLEQIERLRRAVEQYEEEAKIPARRSYNSKELELILLLTVSVVSEPVTISNKLKFCSSGMGLVGSTPAASHFPPSSLGSKQNWPTRQLQSFQS